MARKQTKQDGEIDVVDWLRKLPKVELHLHLEGTIQPETLLELSRRHDAEPLTPEAAKKLYVYENFLGFMDSFKAVSARLKGPDDYELITYNMIRDLASQGVVHAEVYISFGIIFYWKNAEVEPYAEAIERGRVRGERDFGTSVYWLIDAVRLSLGPAFLFLISAEAIAAENGLGYRIFLVRRFLAMDVILPYVAWITLLAYLMDYALAWLSRAAFPWAHKDWAHK